MREKLFHGDETRWEVFEEVEGKTGHRWYPDRVAPRIKSGWSILPTHSRRHDDVVFRCSLLAMGSPKLYEGIMPSA